MNNMSQTNDHIQKLHTYGYFIEKNGVKIIECKTCKYKHIFPMPTKEELEEFYKNNYQESTPSPNFEDKKETILKNIPSSGHQQKRILDIGCWAGDFLDLFPSENWSKVGIEPNPQKAAMAERKGIKVYKQVLEKIDFNQLGKFNAINLSFILEHLLNPKEILEIIYHQLLYSNGIICVEVPNEFNPLQDAIITSLKLERWWISTPDHVNYFNFDTLRRLLTDIGFDIVLEETSFPMELFVLMGDNYIKNSAIGKKVHQQRLKFEKNLLKADRNDLKRKFYQLLPKLNIGRSVIIYAKKQK